MSSLHNWLVASGVAAALTFSIGAPAFATPEIISSPTESAVAATTPKAALESTPTPEATSVTTPTAEPSESAPPLSEETGEAIQQDVEPPTSGLGARLGQGAKRAALEDPIEDPPSTSSVPMARSLAAPAGVYGMDVSGWQANPGSYSVSQVDWNRQWSLGSRFVYAKATEGTGFVDASRASHLSGANRVGMLQGAYHFALPGQGTAKSQADFFVNNGGTWKADGKSLPPLLDIEYNPYSSLGNTCYNLSASSMVNWIRDFSNQVKTRTGRLPMIYTTTDWWNRCTGGSTTFGAQPLHIAAYSSNLGAIPKGWAFHSVWQYSSTGPFAGDSNLWNGTLESLKKFAGTAAVVAPPVVLKPNPSIRTAGDVIAADSSGTLWNYPSSGNGTLNVPRIKIGAGWSGIRSITVTDWNADGIFDMVAQWTNGKVTTYLGRSGGGFDSGPVLASSGWAKNQLAIGPWVSGSKYPQVISREDGGALALWSNTSGGTLTSKRIIGSGWTGLDLAMIDLDNNKTQDLLARNANGDLILYRSDGKGNFVSQARPKISSGWGSMTSISVATGFAGGNSSGIVARTDKGALSYYPAPGNSTLGAPKVIGNSWNVMTIAGGENIPALKPLVIAPPVAPSPPPVKSPHKLAPSGIPAIASAGDTLSIDKGGYLLVHKYTASGAYKSPVQIGHGFQAFRAVQAVDFNSDGIQDIVAQRTDKSLTVYYGGRSGGFSSTKVIAPAGWAGTEIATGKWKTSDKYPGIISKDASGRLMHWSNPNGSSLSSAQQIGNGWNNLRIAMVDFDRNGTQDILAVNTAGSMLLYRSNGSGNFVSQARPVVGSGWGGIKSFRGIPGINGVNALVTNGELRHYPIVKANTWGASRIVTKSITGSVVSP